MTLRASLDALVRELEDELGVGEPQCVPPDFAHREGHWNGRSVTLKTHLRGARDPLATLRYATLESPADDIGSLTFVAAPRVGTGLPILAFDIVGFSSRLSLVAFDIIEGACALDPIEHQRIDRIRARLHQRALPRGPSSAAFSSLATVVALPRAELPLALLGAKTYASVFASSLRSVHGGSSLLDEQRQRSYFSAMAAHMRTLPALVKFFGSPWTTEYFDRCFFDERTIQ